MLWYSVATCLNRNFLCIRIQSFKIYDMTEQSDSILKILVAYTTQKCEAKVSVAILCFSFFCFVLCLVLIKQSEF